MRLGESVDRMARQVEVAGPIPAPRNFRPMRLLKVGIDAPFDRRIVLRPLNAFFPNGGRSPPAAGIFNLYRLYGDARRYIFSMETVFETNTDVWFGRDDFSAIYGFSA